VFDSLPNLQRVTFNPWFQGWSIDIAVREGSDELNDHNIMRRVRGKIASNFGYINQVLTRRRNYEVHFIFILRYLLPGKVLPYRWQLKKWSANLDLGTIDRDAVDLDD
jgi:hypothetical protein